MSTNRKRVKYEIIRKILGVTLSLIMVLTTVFGGIGGSLMDKVGLGVDEAYAKVIGNKNETQKQVCDNVAGGTAPAGYTDVLGNGSVYRGGQAKSGVTEGGKHYIDDDPDDFANSLPYGNVFVDTSKLSWSNPANFIIDIKDDRFKWVGIAGNVLEDALGTKQETEPLIPGKTLTDERQSDVNIENGFIAYVGELKPYHNDIKAVPDDKADNTNIIEAPAGDYLYRITYLNAATLADGTRGNVVMTMTKVEFETSINVGVDNPRILTDKNGNTYQYTKAIVPIQGPNDLEVVGSLVDSEGNFVNEPNIVVKTKEEVDAAIAAAKAAGGNIPANYSDDKVIRHTIGGAYTFDIQVYDAEGKAAVGTMAYAAKDLDLPSYQTNWGRERGSDPFMYAEGLSVLSGTKSYALVPEYNHKDATTLADGWVPDGISGSLDSPLSISGGSNSGNADGVRFASTGEKVMRDKNGKWDDVLFGGPVTNQGELMNQPTGTIMDFTWDNINNSRVRYKNPDDIWNIYINSTTYKATNIRRELAGKIKRNGTVVPWNQITIQEIIDYFKGGSYSVDRDDNATYDSGFAVLIDPAKTTFRWTGSTLQSGTVGTKLFDSTIFTYAEATHGTGGGIYFETYNLADKNCPPQMNEGTITMGRGENITATAVPEDGYRVSRILIGDTNYGHGSNVSGLRNYTTYIIDGNKIKDKDGNELGTFEGSDSVDGFDELKTGTVTFAGFNYDKSGAKVAGVGNFTIERNADGSVDVTLPNIDNPMHVHADFDADYYFYKVWKGGSTPEPLNMTAAPGGVYPTGVTIPMPTGEYVTDGEGNVSAVTEEVTFEISGSRYTATNGEHTGVEFTLSPNNIVEYVEVDPNTGEETFAIRSTYVLAGNEFIHQRYDADTGEMVIDDRRPVTIETSVADWDSDEAKDFKVGATEEYTKDGYVTVLDKDDSANDIAPGNIVWKIKYPSEGVASLNWPALPVEMLPKDDNGNVVDNHEAANHTDRYYWFVTEEVPAWSSESYDNTKADAPGVVKNPSGKDGYYDNSLWAAASVKDAATANALIHEDHEYSYAYMSVFENGGEIANEPSLVIRGRKEWQNDFDNAYETRENIWLHLDVIVKKPDGSTIERKDILPPQMVAADATGNALTKNWGTKATYATGDPTVRVVASTKNVPGNAKLQAVNGTKLFNGPYRFTRFGTTTYYYINELKETEADGTKYEYSIRETLDWEGNKPVEKDNIDKGLLGYTSEDVADWGELKANEDQYDYKYKYDGKNRNTKLKRYTGTVENKYELVDFTVTKKWVDNKEDDEHTVEEIKDKIKLYDTNGEVDLEALGQSTTNVGTDDNPVYEPLGQLTVEVNPNNAKEYIFTWKHLPKYIGDGDGDIVYAGYYAQEPEKFDGYTEPMYKNQDEIGTPDVDESQDDKKAFDKGIITNAQLINVNVVKIWDDADNQDGKRGDIDVTLYQNGVPYEAEGVTNAATLTESNAKKSKTDVEDDTWTWEKVWTDLPYADASGTKYNYTAQETVKPEGYDSDQSTQQIVLSEWNDDKDTLIFTATNKHDPEKISFTVTKVWDDADNQDGMRPEKGEVTYTIKAQPAGGSAETLSELPEGAAIKQGDSDITANFDAGNIAVDTADGDTIMVIDLNKYAKAGNEITYTIEEVKTDVLTGTDGAGTYKIDVTGVQSAGFTVTNTHTPEKVTIPVTKIWDDADNQDGKRTPVTFRLFADGVDTGKTIELTDADAAASNTNQWTKAEAFKDLPKYANGEEIVYTVKEETNVALANADYTKDESAGNKDGSYTITNTKEPETVSLTVTKVWEDADNQDGKRPTDGEVTYNVMADGNPLELPEGATVTQGNTDITGDFAGGSITVKTTNEDGDTITIENLNRYANGEEIDYTIEEVSVDNYDTQISGDQTSGFTVTNFYEPEQTEVFVEKAWDDNNNQDGQRPTNVVFELIKKAIDEQDVDESKGTITLSDSNNWKGSFTGLDKFQDGKSIVYTIVELMESALNGLGYTAGNIEGDGTRENPFKITNSKEAEKVTVKATKVWNDRNNWYRIRKDAEFILLADGVEIDRKTISKDATGEDLTVYWEVDKYRNGGAEIEYRVTEDANDLSPYSFEITGNASDGFTITNIFPPRVEETTVKRTIVYTYIDENGKEASATVVQEVKLERVPLVINASGGVVRWSDWEIVEGDTDSVTSPEIEGWTPDRPEVPEWEIDLKNPKDAFERVIYQPEPPVGNPDETYGGKGESQTGTPTFEVSTPTTPSGTPNEIVETKLIDPKTGEPTDSKTVEVDEGTYTLNDDGTITFEPNDPEYVGNPTPVEVQGTDSNGLSATTTYTPHIVDNEKTVKRTITYEYSDGTPVEDENGDPLTDIQTVTFVGEVDPKTGEVTFTEQQTHTFTEVESPEIEGYNPDKPTVGEDTVTPNDKDIEILVVYNPKGITPMPDETWGLKGEDQTGEPTFEVETKTLPDGKPNEVTPDSIKLINPLTGEPTTDPVTIAGQGTYTLNGDGTITFRPEPDFVGDPQPVGVQGTDKLGNTAKTTYTPHVVDPTETGEATRTIHYTYLTEDGEEVTDDTVQTAKLERKATAVDPKTGEVTEWGPWSKATLPAVDNPDDKATKDGKTWTTTDVVEDLDVTEPGDKGIVNVVYQPEPEPLDPPTGPEEDTYGGKGDTQTSTPDFKFEKGTGEIPEKGAYTLEDPDENDPLKKTIPGEGVYTLDPDTGKVTFEPEPDFVGDGTGVTVKVTDENGLTATGKYTPHVVDNVQESTAKRTIEYYYDDGTPVLDEEGNPLTDVEEKTFKRTGKVDPKTGEITSWNPWNEETFSEVVSPDIDGYTPDRDKVDSVEAKPGDDIKEVVVYVKDPPHEETETTKVMRTIRYRYLDKNGEEAFADVVQEITLTRVKWVDDDGNVVSVEDWIPEDAAFEEVTSPTLENYDVDRTSVPKLEVKDLEFDENGYPKNPEDEYVIYTPKTIWVTYVDPDETIDPYLEKTDVPKAATGQKQQEPEAPDDPTKPGYTFDGWDRSVDEEGNITYTAKWIPDEPVPEPVTETETKTVTRTIRYWIETVNGEMAFEDVVQTVTFTRTKTTDAEGNVTYTEWESESPVFIEVVSKDKEGYTVDRKSVPKVEVSPDDKDIIEDVIYTPVQTPPTPPTPPNPPTPPTPEKTYWTTYVDPDGTTIYLEKTYKTVGAAEPPAPADPTKDGFTFDGWDRSVDEDGNITYTARWIPKTPDDPTPDDPTPDDPTPDDPTPDDPNPPTPDDPTPDDPNPPTPDDPTPVDPNPPTPGEPTIWVRYIDSDGNIIYMDKTNFDQNIGEPPAPANPTKDGYVFDGWDRSVDSVGNITYIARWKPVSTITPTPSKPSTPTKPATGVPTTGDQSNASMWIGILVMAVLVAVIAFLIRMRSKSK